jgi:hypothetical protein
MKWYILYILLALGLLPNYYRTLSSLTTKLGECKRNTVSWKQVQSSDGIAALRWNDYLSDFHYYFKKKAILVIKPSQWSNTACRCCDDSLETNLYLPPHLLATKMFVTLNANHQRQGLTRWAHNYNRLFVDGDLVSVEQSLQRDFMGK